MRNLGLKMNPSKTMDFKTQMVLEKSPGRGLPKRSFQRKNHITVQPLEPMPPAADTQSPTNQQ